MSTISLYAILAVLMSEWLSNSKYAFARVLKVGHFEQMIMYISNSRKSYQNTNLTDQRLYTQYNDKHVS